MAQSGTVTLLHSAIIQNIALVDWSGNIKHTICFLRLKFKSYL